MLADLVSRGPSADDGLLVVIDGAKALRTTVNEVFGDLTTVQRCTLLGLRSSLGGATLPFRGVRGARAGWKSGSTIALRRGQRAV